MPTSGPKTLFLDGFEGLRRAGEPRRLARHHLEAPRNHITVPGVELHHTRGPSSFEPFSDVLAMEDDIRAIGDETPAVA